MTLRSRPTPLLRLALLAALLGALPGRASAGGLDLRLQAWGGVSRYDVRGLKAGLPSQGRDLLQSDVNVYGGSLLLVLGGFDLGVLYEGGLVRHRTDTAVLTPLVGLGFDLGESLRIDLLAELGGHQVSNVQFSGGVDVTQAKAVWLPYAGLRPTLSLRLPAAHPSVILSVAPFARWDLIRTTTTVTLGQGTAVTTGSYELGGSTFGVVAGAGIEF